MIIYFGYMCKDHISKYGFIQKYSEIRTNYIFRGDTVSIHNIWNLYGSDPQVYIKKEEIWEGINEAKSHTYTEDAGDNETEVTCHAELCEYRTHSATAFPGLLSLKMSIRSRKRKEIDERGEAFQLPTIN